MKNKNLNPKKSTKKIFTDKNKSDFNSEPIKKNTEKEKKYKKSRTKEKKITQNKNTQDKATRLNKYIANAGICSRRQADVLIQAGNVSINGKIVTELGIKVMPNDNVCFDGRLIKNEKKVYILLNKPKDYITTADDPQNRKTVLSLIEGACNERVYPVGRLDRYTTGVLLLTNDGELAKKMTHPKYNIKKVYHVSLDRNLIKADMLKIIEGVELDDGIVDVDKISYIDDGSDKKEIGIELHSGKNRVIRRLFEMLGYNVVKLDRVSFASLTKKNLPRGKWRILTEKEINFLKMIR